MAINVVLNGRVHGQTIEFDEPLPCDDGQRVRVMLIPEPTAVASETLPPGEGLRRAFGAWADDEKELDRFIEETLAARKIDRPEIEP